MLQLIEDVDVTSIGGVFHCFSGDLSMAHHVRERGKRNEPAYVRYIAEKVAEIRGTSVEEITESTSQNFARIFSTMG